MAKTYTIEKGDTLARIARDRLGDAALTETLADYNGRPDAQQIFVGQQILLPSNKDRNAATRARAKTQPRAGAAWPTARHGFQAVHNTIGDVLRYIRDDGSIDPKWEPNA